MGNREALIGAAKRCLLEKGFAETTARDIAGEARVSLAAIGYHFGSKEALLTEALKSAIDDWSTEFNALLARSVFPHKAGAARTEATWECLLGTFEAHRALWSANFELFSQMDRIPEIRRVLGTSLHKARTGLAALFLGIDESEIDEDTARTAGGFCHALMSGLIAQFLVDREHAMSAKDLVAGMRLLLEPGRVANRTLGAQPAGTKARERSTKLNT